MELTRCKLQVYAFVRMKVFLAPKPWPFVSWDPGTPDNDAILREAEATFPARVEAPK